jgi:hypothetical protein
LCQEINVEVTNILTGIKWNGGRKYLDLRHSTETLVKSTTRLQIVLTHLYMG